MDTLDLLSCGNQRHHLTRGRKRTTVSLDNHLSLLLSLKLGHAPETVQARRAVRQWLQERLDHSSDHNRPHLSQWLAEEVIRVLVSDEVKNRYNQWLDDLIATNRAARRRASTILL